MGRGLMMMMMNSRLPDVDGAALTQTLQVVLLDSVFPLRTCT